MGNNISKMAVMYTYFTCFRYVYDSYLFLWFLFKTAIWYYGSYSFIHWAHNNFVENNACSHVVTLKYWSSLHLYHIGDVVGQL